MNFHHASAKYHLVFDLMPATFDEEYAACKPKPDKTFNKLLKAFGLFLYADYPFTFSH